MLLGKNNDQRMASLTILLFTLLYLFLPTLNSTSDAIGYARDPAINPHHLFYNLICAAIWHISDGHQVLVTMKYINAMAAGGCLLLCNLYLKQIPIQRTAPWLLLIGASFGLMRFATENEAYIVPVFLSLWGTICLFQFVRNPKPSLMYSGFALLGVAILFHQTHVFWFIAIVLAGIHLWRTFIHFWLAIFASTIAVVVVYVVLADLSSMSFAQFVFRDASNGLVQLIPGLINFKLTGINFIRSWVQIHGNMLLIFASFLAAKIGGIVSILLSISGLFLFIFRHKILTIFRDNIAFKNRALVYIFLLHFLFAWYSVGNAEFMVMLPLLLVLLVAGKWDFPPMSLISFGAGLLLWNLTFAIIPNHFLNYENHAENMRKMRERGPQLFIVQNKITLENMLLPDAKETVVPAEMHWLEQPITEPKQQIYLHKKIMQAWRNNIPVYTDCKDYPQPVNRRKILNAGNNFDFFKAYRLEKTDSFSCFYGKVYIHRVWPKAPASW